MTDTEKWTAAGLSANDTWTAALIRCGLWKPGQPCDVRKGSYFSTDDSDYPDDSDRVIFYWRCHCSAVLLLPPVTNPVTHRLGPNIPHDIPPPKLGDATACNQIIEWAAEEIDMPMLDEQTGEIHMFPEHRCQLELWFGEDLFWHARLWGYQDVQRHKVWYLALASAILALPTEDLP